MSPLKLFFFFCHRLALQKDCYCQTVIVDVHDPTHDACHADPVQCKLQVDYPEGTEFDSSDTSVYFVKSGQVQLKAADKQLQDREVMQTVAQAAVAVQTMAATGPLSKVDFSFPPPPALPLPTPCSHPLLFCWPRPKGGQR